MAAVDHLLAKDWEHIDRLLLKLDPAGTGDVVINLICSSDKTMFYEECQIGNLLQFSRNSGNLLADRGIKWGMTWILIMSKWITMPSGRKIYSNLYSTLLPDAAAQTWIPISNVQWGETWNYYSADAPSFVIVVGLDVTQKYSPGMRIKLTQGTTVKYFIITNVAPSTGQTLITVYGGTDYVLVDDVILDLYYSAAKAPYGFPLDPAKWTVTLVDSTNRTQASPVASTWYNLGSLSISIPIGHWIISYKVSMYVVRATAGAVDIFATFSSANNSESDATTTTRLYGTSIVGKMGSVCLSQYFLERTTKASYYLNAKTTTASMTSINFNNADSGRMVIKALCAYL